MSDTPSRERLKKIVSSICEQQDKMVRTEGMNKELNHSVAAWLEPLKTPIYFLWEFLGYGDFPHKRMQQYWLSSLRLHRPIISRSALCRLRTVISP